VARGWHAGAEPPRPRPRWWGGPAIDPASRERYCRSRWFEDDADRATSGGHGSVGGPHERPMARPPARTRQRAPCGRPPSRLARARGGERVPDAAILAPAATAATTAGARGADGAYRRPQRLARTQPPGHALGQPPVPAAPTAAGTTARRTAGRTRRLAPDTRGLASTAARAGAAHPALPRRTAPAARSGSLGRPEGSPLGRPRPAPLAPTRSGRLPRPPPARRARPVSLRPVRPLQHGRSLPPSGTGRSPSGDGARRRRHPAAG
jgi:hypothetical protein